MERFGGSRNDEVNIVMSSTDRVGKSRPAPRERLAAAPAYAGSCANRSLMVQPRASARARSLLALGI